jgi:hypothetical protein
MHEEISTRASHVAVLARYQRDVAATMYEEAKLMSERAAVMRTLAWAARAVAADRRRTDWSAAPRG